MNKKAAIGLSINTLVIIIISIVMLGGGIALLYQFIGGAEEIKSQLDAKTDSELERLLVDQGKRVALPLHVATVEAGENHVFGVGILNVNKPDPQFYIQVTLSKVSDNEGTNILTEELKLKAEAWTLYNEELITIQENQHHKESILVSVPEDAPKGQYIFKATVKNSGEIYGNPQTFYVNVK